MAKITLSQGVDVMIKDEVAEIHEVVDATDHATGTNPFYQSAKTGESPLANWFSSIWTVQGNSLQGLGCPFFLKIMFLVNV